jgi:hypothetical protein
MPTKTSAQSRIRPMRLHNPNHPRHRRSPSLHGNVRRPRRCQIVGQITSLPLPSMKPSLSLFTIGNRSVPSLPVSWAEIPEAKKLVVMKSKPTRSRGPARATGGRMINRRNCLIFGCLIIYHGRSGCAEEDRPRAIYIFLARPAANVQYRKDAEPASFIPLATGANELSHAD